MSRSFCELEYSEGGKITTSEYPFSTCIGIDVSKEKIGIDEFKGTATKTIGNNKNEICRWIKSLKETSQTIVVMEATGGYESLLVKLRHEHKIALAVVNRRQVQLTCYAARSAIETNRVFRSENCTVPRIARRHTPVKGGEKRKPIPRPVFRVSLHPGTVVRWERRREDGNGLQGRRKFDLGAKAFAAVP